MGQYCDLFAANCLITSTRNDIDPRISHLFTSDELKTYKRAYKDRINFERGKDYDDEIEVAVEYSSNCRIIRDRLNIYGYNQASTEKDFLIGRDEKIEQLEGFIKHEHQLDLERETIDDIEILKKASYQDFLQATYEIVSQNSQQAFNSLPPNPVRSYLLKGKSLNNFPQTDDPRFLISSILSLYSDETPVVYDITELVDASEEDYDEEDEEIIAAEYYETDEIDKFLVLAEGSSDIEIIKSSLKLLYPHLTSYYSFMDFGISNAAGSAGSLVASIKSFIGAGIKNKIIALFDNDTAAEAAMRGLKNSFIPDNIKVLQYPIIELGKNYPTQGPTGLTNMDINGLACSIELYLGRDTLLHGSKLIPVQWKGFEQSLGKYQGEITEKAKIQAKFQTKLKKCLSNKELIKNYDWTELDAVLNSVFNAFNN